MVIDLLNVFRVFWLFLIALFGYSLFLLWWYGVSISPSVAEFALALGVLSNVIRFGASFADLGDDEVKDETV